jgi:hypothetical protein
MTRFDPALARPGSIQTAEANEHGVAIADVAYLGGPGEYELLVTAESLGGLSEEARGVLLQWAKAVGHRRVWLSDQVIDLSDEEAEAGKATVQCPTCLSEFTAEGFSFWQAVRSCGFLPTACKSCGGLLPQWDVAARGGQQES